MNSFEAALDGSEGEDFPDGEPALARQEPEPWEAGFDHEQRAGSGPRLAEATRQWMRLGEHAARLRTVCLDAGLGDALTTILVAAYLNANPGAGTR